MPLHIPSVSLILKYNCLCMTMLHIFLAKLREFEWYVYSYYHLHYLSELIFYRSFHCRLYCVDSAYFLLFFVGKKTTTTSFLRTKVAITNAIVGIIYLVKSESPKFTSHFLCMPYTIPRINANTNASITPSTVCGLPLDCFRPLLSLPFNRVFSLWSSSKTLKSRQHQNKIKQIIQ